MVPLNSTNDRGIIGELKAILDMAMGDESDLPNMLEVAAAVLAKGLAGKADKEDACQAALAVIATVSQWLKKKGDPFAQPVLRNSLRSQINRVIGNAADGPGRLAFINSLRDEYRLKPGLAWGNRTERQHINGALAAVRQTALTDTEVASLKIGDAASSEPNSQPLINSGGPGFQDRQTVINSLRAGWKTNPDLAWGGRTEREYVSGGLLAVGKPALDDTEAGKLGL